MKPSRISARSAGETPVLTTCAPNPKTTGFPAAGRRDRPDDGRRDSAARRRGRESQKAVNESRRSGGRRVPDVHLEAARRDRKPSSRAAAARAIRPPTAAPPSAPFVRASENDASVWRPAKLRDDLAFRS